jgi:hypothetical protein
VKKIFCCLLFSFCLFTANAQLIYVETGKLISSFNFKDSEGNKLENLTESNQNNMGLGFRMSLFKTAWHVSLGTLYNKYSVCGSNQTVGSYYEWNVSYLGANLGIDYEFFKPNISFNEQHGFSFYIRGSVASDFLIAGTQRNNNQVYDLHGVEQFNKPVYFLKGGIGVNYYLSKIFILFTQYNYGRSFLIGDYKNEQQLTFTTNNLSIGLSINIAYRK